MNEQLSAETFDALAQARLDANSDHISRYAQWAGGNPGNVDAITAASFKDYLESRPAPDDNGRMHAADGRFLSESKIDLDSPYSGGTSVIRKSSEGEEPKVHVDRQGDDYRLTRSSITGGKYGLKTGSITAHMPEFEAGSSYEEMDMFKLADKLFEAERHNDKTTATNIAEVLPTKVAEYAKGLGMVELARELGDIEGFKDKTTFETAAAEILTDVLLDKMAESADKHGYNTETQDALFDRLMKVKDEAANVSGSDQTSVEANAQPPSDHKAQNGPKIAEPLGHTAGVQADTNPEKKRTLELIRELNQLSTEHEVPADDYDQKLKEYISTFNNSIPKNLSEEKRLAYHNLLEESVKKFSERRDNTLKAAEGQDSVGQAGIDAAREAFKATRKAQELIWEAKDDLKLAGDDQAKRKLAIGKAIRAKRELAKIEGWDNKKLDLENRRFKYEFGTWLVQPADNSAQGQGRDPMTNADTQPQTQEQAEIDAEAYQQYEARLADLRTALRMAKDQPNNQEEIKRLHSEMKQLILDRAEASGENKDWVNVELNANMRLLREEHEWANAGRFKRATITFRKWRQNPENKLIKHKIAAVAVIGAVSVAAFLAGHSGHSDSASNKNNAAVAVTATTKQPTTTTNKLAPAATSQPTANVVGPSAGVITETLSTQDWTVSHLALKHLQAEGILSPDPAQRQAQIQTETQRILTLNNMTWDDARHLEVGTNIRV